MNSALISSTPLIFASFNSILEKINRFEVDDVSVSIVMTFGQVPLGRTMFTNIKFFRGSEKKFFLNSNQSLILYHPLTRYNF